MSLILETRLTKQEIFTLYANQIYLGPAVGRSIYGVGEASNAYFGKDVSQLSFGRGGIPCRASFAARTATILTRITNA